jgi:hypothetical protein
MFRAQTLKKKLTQAVESAINDMQFLLHVREKNVSSK